MKEKKRTFNSKFSVLDILCGREKFPPILRERWVEGEKYKTSLSPHLQILLQSSPSLRKKNVKAKRGKRKTIQEMSILLENSSMLHTSQRKKGLGLGAGDYHNTNSQHSIFHLLISITILSQVSLSPLSPSWPSQPSMQLSARSLGTAPPLTAVRAAGVLGQETGEGNLCRRKREFICGDCLQKDW